MDILLVYTRVSTEEQAKKGLSLNDQELRGKELARKKGFEPMIFSDEGVSGTIPLQEREGMSKLLDTLYSNDNVKAVFVTDIDRIARATLESLTFYSLLKERKIHLYDVNGRTNIEDENQELLINLKSLFAAFEIKKTSGRIKRVLERNAKEGKVSGGPMQPYGYQKGPNKLLIIDDNEAEVVKFIYECSLQGKGTKVIANLLNEAKIPTKRESSDKGSLTVRGKKKTSFQWRDAVVYRILTNPMYKGKRLFKGNYYDCPSIIEEATFDVVQDILKKRSQFKNTRNKYFYLLKGLLKCGKCGRNFYGRKREDLKDNQYICSSQRYPGEFCGTRGINIDFLEMLVYAELTYLPKHIESYFTWFEKNNVLEESRKKVLELIDIRSKLEKKKQKLFSLFEDDLLPKSDLLNRITRINSAILKTEEDIKKFHSHSKFSDDKEIIIQHVNNNVGIAKNLSTNEYKERVVRALVSEVTIHWDNETLRHHIAIQFNIGKMSQVLMGRTIEVEKRSRIEKVISRELNATTYITKHPKGSPENPFGISRFTQIDKVIDWEKEKRKIKKKR